jgi:hypothetical protein
VKWSEEMESRWRGLAEEVIIGIKEWRLQHPKATFREIEAAVDERLAKARARILQDAALLSAAAEVTKASEEERPRCPTCGRKMEAHGQESRELTTNYNHLVKLTRSYAYCPSCKTGFFPPGR